ncbi:hypothetical protein WJX75_009648 [Coccomyxa subellipsoidea]|uniref:Uncharacterized protein n=1 Tax=Coccomyxa subellipsoidea TaxID=248742 RepID=A0ABR2Z4L7_9CHLO
MQTVKSWQLEPQRALDAHALSTPRPKLLRPRPDRWGDSEPLLLAPLGQLELQEEVPYGNPERMQLELQVTRGLFAHFAPHVGGVKQRGSPGAANSCVELWFDTSRQRLRRGMRRRKTSLSGCVMCLAAATSRYWTGLAQTLLDYAGCPRDTYVVRGEFLGDLPGQLAVGTHGVGNGNACIAYIQTPDDDRHLSRLPKRFFIDGDTRINITRPGQLRQPSQPSSFQSQRLSQRSAPDPLRRSGPRPIRQRQRAAKARTRTAAAAQPTQPAPSAQLQQLEARVQASRAPGGDRSGLGASAAISGARSGPRFRPAGDTQPFTPMDCTPPRCAQILHAARQALTDMEVDAPPPPPPLPSPMEWETQACSVPQRGLRRGSARARDTSAATPMDWDLPHRDDPPQMTPRRPPPLELSGVPDDRVEECLEWLAGHTHFSPADSAAASRRLHSDAPLALRGVVLLFLEGLPLSAARVLGPGDVPVLHQSGLCSGRKEGMGASCPCRARNPSFTGVPGIPCRFQRDTSDTPSTVPILPGL